MSGQAQWSDGERGRYLGFIVAGAIILGVFVVGAAFWFMYHPL